MQIPKRFKLLGYTIEVKEEPAAYWENGRYGACTIEGGWIKIAPISEAHPVSQSSVERTFFHELTHLCLDCTEQADLSKNEKFVDAFAGLLHQAVTTMEYD